MSETERMQARHATGLTPHDPAIILISQTRQCQQLANYGVHKIAPKTASPAGGQMRGTSPEKLSYLV
jgi:hypothetical protein